MNKPLKITKIGNSAGIILPKEVLARLRVEPGDQLYLTEAPDGVRLTAQDPDFEEQMKVAGGTGVRDDGALQSALARPRNRWEYGEGDVVVLAAAYAFGIARNHPFVDGNKRTAWTVANIFLALNDHELVFDEPDAIRAVE